jgi:phosphate:Na+ symporter
LHALDHASRLAEIAGEAPQLAAANGGPEDMRASQLCAEAIENALSVVRLIAEESALSDHAAPIKSMDTPETNASLARLEQCAKGLSDLRQAHRAATLRAVGAGELTADQALMRVDTVRRLDAIAHHVWRSASHLAGHVE